MFKKISVMLLTLVLIGAGCSSTNEITQTTRQEPPENFISYASDYGWQIYYPQNWEIEQSALNERQVFFYAPKESPAEFDHNVNVLYSPEGGEFAGPASLMSFVENSLYEDPVTEVVGTELIATSNGQAAMVDYIARPQGWELKGKEIALLDGDKVYFFVFTAESESFDLYLPDFMAMVDSFTLIAD